MILCMLQLFSTHNIELQFELTAFYQKVFFFFKLCQYLCYIVISFFSLTLTPLLLQQALPSDTRPAQPQLTLTPLLLQQICDTRPDQLQLTLTPLLLQQTCDTRPAQLQLTLTPLLLQQTCDSRPAQPQLTLTPLLLQPACAK